MSRIGDDIAAHACERIDRVMQQAIDLLESDEDARDLLVGVAGYILCSAAVSLGAEGSIVKVMQPLSPAARSAYLAAHIFTCLIRQVESAQERSDLYAAAAGAASGGDGLPLFVLGGQRRRR